MARIRSLLLTAIAAVCALAAAGCGGGHVAPSPLTPSRGMLLDLGDVPHG